MSEIKAGTLSIVDFPFMKPLCFSSIIPNFSTHSSSLFFTSFSRSFPRQFIKEIGRKAFFPGLSIKRITTFFYAVGIFPFFQIQLYRSRMHVSMSVCSFLRMLYVIPSSPGAVDFLISPSAFLSSLKEKKSGSPVPIIGCFSIPDRGQLLLGSYSFSSSACCRIFRASFLSNVLRSSGRIESYPSFMFPLLICFTFRQASLELVKQSIESPRSFQALLLFPPYQVFHLLLGFS